VAVSDSVWTTCTLYCAEIDIRYHIRIIESTHSLSILFSMAQHPTEHRLSPLPIASTHLTCALRADRFDRYRMPSRVSGLSLGIFESEIKQTCARNEENVKNESKVLN